MGRDVAQSQREVESLVFFPGQALIFLAVSFSTIEKQIARAYFA
jgi:hypothetical protein